MPSMSERDRYLSDFESFEKRFAGGLSWLRPIRLAAIERFADVGFPTTRQEDWKYTNVAPIVQSPFTPVFELSPDGLDSRVIGELSLATANRVVFVNGIFSKDLSSAFRLPPGVKVGSLADAMREDPDRIEQHLARYARVEDSGFVALSTAFIRDGAFLYLPNGAQLEEPVQFLFISTAHGDPIVSHPRNLIILGENARATIIESYASPAQDVYLTNAVTEIALGAGAGLEHYRIQRESEQASHIATTQVVQGGDSSYSSFVVELCGRFARHNLNVLLDAEGAECSLLGLYLTAGLGFVDNHTLIDHAKSHGTSREVYKGILGGKSRAVFNGKVIVRKDAQKTDAQQTNKNLLLSDRAEIDTKPQLEIFADDVKCSHGAAIGQLDEQAIFYLRSRGMSEDHARRLMIYGFASDLIRRIRLDSMRHELDAAVATRLRYDSKGTR